MPERRYSDDEVSRILREATTTSEVTPTTGEHAAGMSLAELKEIGREVGIPEEAIARAAGAVDRAPLASTSPVRRLLGMPIGVGESVVLRRKLTEDEWNQLVVAARDVFGARGRLQHDGAFRQWTNGNLQMLLEPTPDGHQLRFRTYNASSRGLILGGVVSGALGTLMGTAALLGNLANPAGELTGAGVLVAVGLGFLTIGAGRLPGWAQLRQRQFQRLAALAEEMVTG